MEWKVTIRNWRDYMETIWRLYGEGHYGDIMVRDMYKGVATWVNAKSLKHVTKEVHEASIGMFGLRN